MSEIVIADHLSKRYEGAENREVLADVSLRVGAGKTLAIMGPSGSGKSTLLHILGTLDRPSGGTVRIANQDPFALSDAETAAFRSSTVGFIFQSHHLLPHCSLLENVLVPTLAASGEKPTETPRARAARLLERVGLTPRIHARPGQCSGGECQRAAVVRALINRPAVLLADEPTGSLDRASAEAVGALIVELAREENVAVVVVTHAQDLARRMDEVFELRNGALVKV